jgi:hypothetical protein
MLDVHLFLNPRMKLRQNGTVSFSIKLAAFQASGWAEPLAQTRLGGMW